MTRPSRAHRLLNEEFGPREVVFDDRFRYHKHLSPDEHADLLVIIDEIKAGAASSERFYRPKSGHKDELLERYGVLHLHLGGETSDTILFLQQFSDRVVLLETNTHRRFWNDSQQFTQLHKLDPLSKPAVQTKKRRRPPPQ